MKCLPRNIADGMLRALVNGAEIVRRRLTAAQILAVSDGYPVDTIATFYRFDVVGNDCLYDFKP